VAIDKLTEGDRQSSRRSTFSRGQRVLIGFNVLIMALVAAAIAGGVLYLANLAQFRMRWDLTVKQSYSLTPRTKAILSALEKDLEVVLIFESPSSYDLIGVQSAVKQVGDYTFDLLMEYAIQSAGRIRVEALDRVRDNLRVEEVLQGIGVNQVNIVLIKCGRSRKVLIPEDLADIDRGRYNPDTGVTRRAKVISLKAEAALTAAIMEVSEEAKPVAYVLSGRGEAQATNSNPDGLAMAAEGLKNANFDVRELKLGVDRAIPEDCDVLIGVGPADEYGPEEMAEIRRYMQQGGNLFLALDPFACKSFDQEMLPAYGLILDRTITCRELSDLQGGRDAQNKILLPLDDLSEQSRITRPLQQNRFRLVFARAGAVRPSLGNASIEELVASPPNVWGDTHAVGEWGDFTYDSLTEKKERRIFAVSCEGQGELAGSRLVLTAESIFCTNQGLQMGGRGNLLFFTNSVNWLAAREVQLEIGPKVLYESKLEIFPEEYHRIGIYVMLVIPAAAALLGIVVWWFRRR